MGPYRGFPLRLSVTQTRHLLALALLTANWKVETGGNRQHDPHPAQVRFLSV